MKNNISKTERTKIPQKDVRLEPPNTTYIVCLAPTNRQKGSKMVTFEYDTLRKRKQMVSSKYGISYIECLKQGKI